jgi:lipopolysaccharide/colanic/teichoic acid biosynthesis glycosyltransferase
MIAKRCFDLLVAVMLLLVLLPLLLLIALAVAVGSGRPVIYRAQRVGRRGNQFAMLKFRTMLVGAQGPAITGQGDPRITRVGAVLRRTKLDELLQLVNVLCGDMSLVGPRPEDPRFVAMYTPEQREVLTIRPGITSPAAIRYRYEETLLTTSTQNFEQVYATTLMPAKLALDLDYVHRRSFWWDIAVLCQSLTAVLSWRRSESPRLLTPS